QGSVINPPGVGSFVVTFNEGVLDSSFTTNQVTVSGPGGVLPKALVSVTGSGAVWQISFPAPETPGLYTFTISPSVRDPANNALDQNGNLKPGESGDSGDSFSGQVSVAAPLIDLGNPNTPITGEIRPESGLITFLRLTPIKLSAKLARLLRLFMPGVPVK